MSKLFYDYHPKIKKERDRDTSIDEKENPYLHRLVLINLLRTLDIYIPPTEKFVSGKLSDK